MKKKPLLGTVLISFMLISILLPCNSYGQITSITFYPFKQFILVGQTKQLTFELIPSTYSLAAIKFMSSDTNLITVDDKGYITGKKPGWAYVYVLSKYSTAGDMMEVFIRDDNTSMKIEGEDAIITSPLRITNDPTASGGQCLIYDSGPHSQTEVPDSGHAIFNIDVEEEGLYSLYINLKAFDRNNNSFYYKVDTLDWRTISAPDTTWSEETKSFTHNFTGIIEYPFLAGEHKVEIAYRQPGVKMDYIRLIRDSSSVHRYESHYSEIFGERRWINVLLPSYYDQTDKRFPVMTFSHGWGGAVFRESEGMGPHLNFNRIQEHIDEDSVIFVFTDGKIEWFDNGEMSKYSPYNMVPIYDLYYEDYFPELFDYMDSNYRTIPDRYHRAVMGQSMGGGMVLRLGLRYPDLIAAVQPTCAGANHLLGLPDRYIRYYTHEFVKNFHGTHVRLHETFGDYLNTMNKVLYAAMEREQLENIAWSEIEGHHTVDIAGRTIGFDSCFNFMLASIKDPLPAPERWHFTDFRPDFHVWNYNVTSNMERQGFLDFTGITKGGMKVFARKWLPDGPGLPDVTINITTAPFYKTNSSYTLLTYDLTEESSSTESVMSDNDGRISFSVSGKGYQVGIYDNETPPEIVILAYNINDSTKFLTQGMEGQLKIQVLNRGGQSAENIIIAMSTDQSSVSIEEKILTIPFLDAGTSLWLDETIGITADYNPPEIKAPIELRLNASIADGSGSEWKDELYVPIMFNVPAISNFIINDNIPEGTDNRVNGFAEPGEKIILETALEERLRLQYDDEYVEFAEEEAIFPDYTLSYSIIKISEDAPVGHQVTFLARLEEYDASVELTGYTWKKLTLEISDHTSARNNPEFKNSQDRCFSVYPNPVSYGLFTLELGPEIPAGELSLKIMDTNGRIVFSTIINREENVNRYLITPGGKVNNGLYIISLESNHFISRTKLIIQ
jgi:enterochelin esterase-like enzyme